MPHAVAKLPWSHNRILLDKAEKYIERLWYAEQTIENAWSRATLVHQIESGLYQRQALSTKVTNFKQTLSGPQSDLAEHMRKNLQNLGFLNKLCL